MFSEIYMISVDINSMVSLTHQLYHKRISYGIHNTCISYVIFVYSIDFYISIVVNLWNAVLLKYNDEMVLVSLLHEELV